MAEIQYDFTAQLHARKKPNKYTTAELEEALNKFSSRQYFIGITEDEICVRCLYLRLWTGRWVLADNDIWDGEAVKEYSHNVFILERGFSDKRVVGVK